MFRFSLEQLKELCVGFHSPTYMHTDERDRFMFIEGLALVCRKLLYPVRWVDLIPVWGRSEGSLSRIYVLIMSWLDYHYGRLLDFVPEVMQHRLPEWADLVHRRGAPFRNVVLFIDGSLFQTCRPHPKSFLRLHLRAMGVTADALQRAFYSGHKRHHGMKFHAVTAPNGLFWLYGPEDGRRHDLTLFQNANLFHLITRPTWVLDT